MATALLCVLTACGAANTNTSSPPPSSTTPAVPTPGASGPAGGGVMLSEPQNGTTVQASRGSSVTVVLHSTYWHIGGSNDQSVLRAVTGANASPSPGCVAGAGCGTVSEMFIALAQGTATIMANRVTCGEARLCVGPEKTYTVTVVVTGG
ncbi:MAG: hypothetical protein ABR498_02750 [Candidatus Dormibacteria bacterium]